MKKCIKSISKLLKKRSVRIGIAILLVLVVALIIFIKINPFPDLQDTKIKSPPLVTEQDKTAQVPFFATLVPTGKSIEQLGGWTRISPPDKNAVFAYIDSIDNNRIVVGQQPLPEDFKEDTESQVEGLAKSYKTSEKVVVNGVTVFFATSSKGPQAVIFVKKDLLVNIRSSVTIAQDKWISYINSLE